MSRLIHFFRRIGLWIAACLLFSVGVFPFLGIQATQAPDITNVYITSTVTAEHIVCGAADTLRVSYANASSVSLTGQTISLKLASGMSYQTGSVFNNTGHNVQESDISNLNAPVFTIDDVAAGANPEFGILYSPDLDTRSFIIGGGTPRDSVILATDQGVERHQTNGYNALYAALNLTNVSPGGISLRSGDSTTRSITIVNGGYGRVSSLYLTDLHSSGLDWYASDLGTLNQTGDTVFFGPADFAAIGNGNGYFDAFESMSFTQSLAATGCTDQTITSTINTHWGCGNDIVKGLNSYGNVDISLKLPNLTIQSSSELQSCFGTGAGSPQGVTLTNNGQGIAINVSLDIFKSSGGGYNQTLFSRIDTSSISLSIDGGAAQKLNPTTVYSTTSTGAYSCLGANPIGRFYVDLPDMDPGTKYEISWNTYNCCVDVCAGEQNTGWKYTVGYDDVCGSNPVSTTGTGETTLSAIAGIFTESPADMSDGQTENFRYTISSLTNQYPAGEGAYYELVFDIPVGLLWSGTASDLEWVSGISAWSAYYLDYQSGSRRLTARFSMPQPFHLPKSEINLILTADCDEAGASPGDMTLSLDVNYIPDSSCVGGICAIPMVCQEDIVVELNCPGPCNEGMQFDGISFARTSFGQADNDQDGEADESGSLDPTKIKDKRVMFGDSLRSVFRGVTRTSQAHSSWAYGYAESEIELGTHLSVISAHVSVWDASSGTTLSCVDVISSSQDNGSTRTFGFDYSPASLAASCSDFASFAFGEGDSVWLTVDYAVTTNPGGMVEEVRAENTFFLSDVPNPASGNRYFCQDWDNHFTLIGYYFLVFKADDVTITSCSRTVSQSYYLSIGDCCSNYNGGNLFPYEYRNWAHIKRAWVVIPQDYEVMDISHTQYRTRHTNSTLTESQNSISASAVSGDTLFFDLDQHYVDKGGNLGYSDDGFSGKLDVTIAPTCDVATATWQDMPWAFTFQPVAQLGGMETDWIQAGSADRVRFTPPKIALRSPNRVQDGIMREVSWSLRVRNTNGQTAMDNAWIHLESNPDLEIVSVTEADTALPYTGDIYRVGAIAQGSRRKLTIKARYQACGPENLTVYAGFECSGYPANFASFNCSFASYNLTVEPKDAELQARISAEEVGSACADSVQLTYEINSVQLAHADSVWVDLSPPASGGLSYIPGTAEMKYPLPDNYAAIADPSGNGSSLSWSLADLQSRIAARGLPGVSDLDSNRVRLTWTMQIDNNFQPGDFLVATVRGKSPCGAPLGPINLSYDPSVSFKAASGSLLEGYTTDSWSASWGDYDGDGYDDLFVTEYSDQAPNYLFHNEGDGTFSRVHVSPFNTDLASSLASSWGDYDNDGDMDLFVANNIGAPNWLYENQGNGVFVHAAEQAINTYNGYCHSASWVDYDNDGYLDLYVVDYMPTRFNQLYHNNGDGTFDPQEGAAICLEPGYAMGATWADYDLDGDQDVFIPMGRESNNLFYRNDGAGNFSRITSGSFVNDGGNSVGSSWGDYDNDGDPDLYVTNASGQANFFYENQGNGTFAKVSTGLPVTETGNSHGSAWGDVDNDGDLDLFVSNDRAGKNALYINMGDGSFGKFENLINDDTENSMGSAWADYDNDGDLDLFVANNLGTTNSLYDNSRGSCSSWWCANLIGTNSNRNGYGAKIKVKANIYGQDIWQTRELSAQTGGGSGSQNSNKMIFGLGDAAQVDSVIIEWPSGYTQYLVNQSIGGCNEITEETGILLSGTVYHDADSDCVLDSGEQVLSGVKIEIGPADRYVVTDKNGYYEVYLPAGSYSIDLADENPYTATCPPYYNETLTEGNTYTGRNFAVEFACTGPNLEVSLGGTAQRVGAHNYMTLQYANWGVSNATNASVSLSLSSEISLVTSTPAWTSETLGETNVYTWVLDSIPSQSLGTIQITDSVSATALVGTYATADASIGAHESDCDPASATFSLTEEIVGAVDPNDLLVFPPHFITPGDSLWYRVRFQNVGNAPARRVVIRDTLPAELDVSSLHLEASSHPCVLDVSPEGIMVFTFPEINLPDSVHNEPESHGYVNFRVLPAREVERGSLIRNQASIYFDQAPPIHTNETFSLYTDPLSVRQSVEMKLLITPQPTREKARIRITNPTQPEILFPISRWEVYDQRGTLLTGVEVASELHTDIVPRVHNLTPGFYLLRAYDVYGFRYAAKWIITP